ncbi:MAG: hypothetical protein AB1512_16425 [Thermodesulfobacteriota bacterium]
MKQVITIMCLTLLVPATCIFLVAAVRMLLFECEDQCKRNLYCPKAYHDDGKPVESFREFHQGIGLLDQPIRILFHPICCLGLLLGNKRKDIRQPSGLDACGSSKLGVKLTHLGEDFSDVGIHHRLDS